MKLSSLFVRPPVQARHVKRTYVTSADDEASRPNRALIRFALDAILRAQDLRLDAVSARMKTTPRWPDIWPGEHYRLLAAMVDVLRPRRVVEIGTFTGLSALCLRQALPAGSTLTTFDLLPWEGIPDTVLRAEDFADGAMKQVLADLADPAVFASHRESLLEADLLFVDGPKDGRFEPAFARLLDTLPFVRPPWVVFDDIRDLHMLQFWHDMPHPKLDLSGFGHWTGTGLVQWGGRPDAQAPGSPGRP